MNEPTPPALWNAGYGESEAEATMAGYDAMAKARARWQALKVAAAIAIIAGVLAASFSVFWPPITG